MADVDRATCPRCGAPSLSDHPASLCPSCLVSDPPGGEDPPVSKSSGERAARKVSLASTVAAIRAILIGVIWFKNRRGPQRSGAEAHSDRGTALYRQGRLDEAAAEHRAALRLKPGLREP